MQRGCLTQHLTSKPFPPLTFRPASNRQCQRQPTLVPTAAKSDTYYQGTYGPWKVEQSDVVEVLTYRAGISVTALAFAAGTAAYALAPDAPWAQTIRDHGTVVAAVGAAGLGVSLVQIHIYVTPLKRMLQAFWGLGTLGGLYIVATQDLPVPDYVVTHPSAVWLIGPAFAALTGMTFKEGVCYGKAEAFLLTLGVPALLLGHLSGLLHGGVAAGFGATVASLLLVFAGRKFEQQLKDDIGDKSVFEFRALPEEAQMRRVAELRARGGLLYEEVMEGDLENADDAGW